MVKNKSLKRFIILFSLSIVVTLGFIKFFGLLEEYYTLKEKNFEVERLLEKERKIETELSDIIAKLDNPDYLKSYAKENYLYTEDGIVIIKLPSDEEE